MASILNVDKIRATGSTTDAVTVDSTGRMFTPARPAFRARNSGITNYTTASSTMVFNTTDFNVGSGYSTSTGVFTCPVAGMYMFSYNLFSLTGNTCNIDLLHESAIVSRSEIQDSTSGYQSTGATVLIECAANDEVKLFLNSGQVHTNTGLNHFSGCLMG